MLVFRDFPKFFSDNALYPRIKFNCSYVDIFDLPSLLDGEILNETLVIERFVWRSTRNQGSVAPATAESRAGWNLVTTS